MVDKDRDGEKRRKKVYETKKYINKKRKYWIKTER